MGQMIQPTVSKHWRKMQTQTVQWQVDGTSGIVMSTEHRWQQAATANVSCQICRCCAMHCATSEMWSVVILLWLVHTADANKTRLSCLVLSVSQYELNWRQVKTENFETVLSSLENALWTESCLVLMQFPILTQCGYLLWCHIWKLGQD